MQNIIGIEISCKYSKNLMQKTKTALNERVFNIFLVKIFFLSAMRKNDDYMRIVDK